MNILFIYFIVSINIFFTVNQLKIIIRINYKIIIFKSKKFNIHVKF